MNNKEISKVIDSNLPSNIDFTFLEEELTIVLGKESVYSNMQEDASAFEGWIFCIKSALEDKKYCINKIRIKFSGDIQLGCTPRERQFCYRLFKCHQNYAWDIPVNPEIMINVSSLRDAVLTSPKNNPVIIENAHNIESRLERQYIEFQRKKGKTINQQLPLGLFKNTVAEVNRLTLTSFLDMWEIYEDSMRIYELKAKGNNKVGIISELMYYTNMMSDILNGRFCFEPNKKNYRGVGVLKVSIGKIKSLEGVFLTDSLHPLIAHNKEKLFESMKFVSGGVNVSFTFEQNTDDISEYNDFRENQREHHFIS